MPFFRSNYGASGGGDGGEDTWNESYLEIISNNNFFTDYPLKLEVNTELFLLNNYGWDIESLQEFRVGNCVRLLSSVFSGYRSGSLFNGIVNLQGATSLYSAGSLMNNCSRFNSTVIFPDYIRPYDKVYPDGPNISSGSQMSFYQFMNGCYNYNQPIHIKLREMSSPSNANIYASLGLFFNGCSNLNSKVTFEFDKYNKDPNSIANSYIEYSCSNMFNGCYKFNQPMIFPIGITSSGNIFNYCSNFDQPVVFDTGYYNTYSYFGAANCFYCAPNMRSDIIFTNVSDTTNMWINKLIYSTNNSRSINIYSNNIEKITAVNDLIYGVSEITWSEVTNGVYNEMYNIYVLNNVSDGLNTFNNYYYNFYGELPVF